MVSTDKEVRKMDELIKKSNLIEDGNPARYRLKATTDNLDQSESYRKIIVGERDTNKAHKIILMVGETGSGKSTLVNAMINYSCGVQREDKVWFEITDDQSDSENHSQTSIITVYGVYIQETSVDLTIIDTPGYGNTCGVSLDQEIDRNLLILCTSEDGLHKINAVCFVINASQTRISERQHYIFDAVQSLFGKDIAENIVLHFTHSTGAPPKNALTAVKEAKVKCAVDEKKNQPIYFLFDNCQSMPWDEEYGHMLEQSWNLSYNGILLFFKFLENIEQKTLQNTTDVLHQRKKLEATVSNLQLCVQKIEQKTNELKQTQEDLEKEKNIKENNNFEYEVRVLYKEKIPTNLKLCCFTKKVTSCSVCEENCHYPECWCICGLSCCSVMKKNHCTVCTNKCHYSKHIREDKIYETNTRVEKRTLEDLKMKNDVNIQDCVSSVSKLEEELHVLGNDKIKLLNEAFDCVKSLEIMALNTFSLFTIQHIDFLTEKFKEINEPEKAEALENIKKREGEGRKGALDYVKKVFTRK